MNHQRAECGNGFDNALDALPERGNVAISASRERHRVAVRIVDDGPGIPPEVRDRMFEHIVQLQLRPGR